ncbi:hypothetical protein COO60DRAFT_1505165 [Scenedesmus sp. NREL 46B-D3]|nr:hypothetical protein COO60DRAFT_1505165 [Scenedesmus sp. NREL 46B-D3]
MSTELGAPSGQASDQPNNGAAGMEVDAQAAQQQAGSTTDQPSIRVLALYCTGSSDETDPGFDPPESSNASLLSARSGVEVEMMRGPSLDEFAARVESYKPTFVYVSGHTVTSGELLTALEGAPLDTVYLDAAGQEKVAELLRTRGVPNVMFWSEDPSGLVAAHFSSIFFSMLALESSVSILEAYALALFSTQAHLGAKVDGKLTMPNMPDLLTGPADDPDGVTLALPDNSSVPLPQLPGLDLSRGVAAAVEGWMDVRLLAPRAELRVQVGGGSSMVDAGRLSYLGEALRALLVLEVRRARLVSANPPTRLPSHLQEGCSALLCEVATSSGATVRVVLGGRPAVLSSQQLVEHALRQTLVADALSLQFRLPPPGVPLPLPRAGQDVLGGCPCVDTLLLTSVWAVGVLRQLAQSAAYRGLVSLGVGSVGGAPVAGCKPADASRLGVIVTGMRGGVLLTEELLANGLPIDGISGSLVGGIPSSNPLAVPADPPIAPHNCGRTSIADVKEDEFTADLISFLSHRRGRYIDRSKFPDAVLNGMTLDLFGLYKEVVTRGGFRVGNGINWKGQVFGRMRNWTANNRQTGVGNSLKKHYANLLWEYEQAHPQDVVVDRCTLCGRGEEAGATDWIACDSCNSWVHFSGARAGRGAAAAARAAAAAAPGGDEAAVEAAAAAAEVEEQQQQETAAMET